MFTFSFELTNAGACTAKDIVYTYEIYAPDGLLYSGTEIIFDSVTATIIIHILDPSSIPGDYLLEVTATLGLTSTQYVETITIAADPTLVWKSTPLLPTAIDYSVGSSENKEIVIDP
jgi:hypothetical protein